PIMFACARGPLLAILNDSTLDTAQRAVRERELFHLDHTEVGRAVAQKLELPELFVDAIAFHHQRANLRALLPQQVLADAAEVAALVPHRLDIWNATDGAALRAFLRAARPHQPLDDHAFLSTVQDEFSRLYAYFESGDRPALKLVELLEQAARNAADATTQLIGTVQDLMSQAASTGKEVHRLIRAQDYLQETADHDALTGALSRQGFMVRAGETLTNARRYRSSLALIFLDIDSFKSINDTFGHAAGDAALQAVVNAAQAGVRQQDLVGRLGGDEFVLLLTDTSREQALAITQRIMAQIAAQRLPEIAPAKCRLTLSAGLCWVSQTDSTPDLDEWLRSADQLMYAAKHAGGNTVKLQADLPTPVAAGI
ncbi:MAG: diguanylate cyclase, partial [Phycisphaerae bacterium]